MKLKKFYETTIETKSKKITKIMDAEGITVKECVEYKLLQPKTPAYKGFNQGIFKDEKNHKNYKQMGL